MMWVDLEFVMRVGSREDVMVATTALPTVIGGTPVRV